MTGLRKALVFVWLAVFASALLAQDRSAGHNEIAMDIELSDGRADVRIDDVPFFGFGESVEAEASLVTSLPANMMLGPGRNDVVVRFWPGKVSGEPAPRLRLRFGYAPGGSEPTPFREQPYAIQMTLHRDTAAAGGYALVHEAPGQPLMRGELMSSQPRALPDGGLEVALRLQVAVALPEQRWKSGARLSAHAATRQAVEARMRSAHAAFAQGRQSAQRHLAPLLERQGASIGVASDKVFDTQYAPFIDPSLGFRLQPFDASKSKLEIFGGGRLATLTPSPVVFTQAQLNEARAPRLYFWRDASGQWQIWH